MASRVIALDQLQQFTAVQLLSDPGAIGGPVVIPQCAQIVIQWNLTDGKQAHQVLVGRYSGSFAGSPTQAQAILTALTTGAAWTALAPFMNPAAGIGAVTIRDVNTANQAIISSTAPGPPGTGSGSALPDEVAVALTLRTALAGRANRGRSYVPNWNTSALGAGNVVAAGAVTALSNWGATYLTALSANGYTLVIGQKARAAYMGSTGTNHPARPAGSVPVTQVICRDNHWDTQKRRGLK